MCITQLCLFQVWKHFPWFNTTLWNLISSQLFACCRISIDFRSSVITVQNLFQNYQTISIQNIIHVRIFASNNWLLLKGENFLNVYFFKGGGDFCCHSSYRFIFSNTSKTVIFIGINETNYIHYVQDVNFNSKIMSVFLECRQFNAALRSKQLILFPPNIFTCNSQFPYNIPYSSLYCLNSVLRRFLCIT